MVIFCVVLGDRVRILTPINVCHFNAYFAWTTKMLFLVRVDFLCSCRDGLLCSQQPFNLIYELSRILYIVRNMGQFTYSKCKLANLLWFAHLCINICGGAQLLSCSHPMYHPSIMLIFQVNLIGQESLLGDKTKHFSCTCLPSIAIIWNPNVFPFKQHMSHVSRSYKQILF